MAGARKSVEAAMPYGTELSAPTIGLVHVTRKFFWFVAMDVDVWSHKIAVGQGCLCPISTHLSMFVSGSKTRPKLTDLLYHNSVLHTGVLSFNSLNGLKLAWPWLSASSHGPPVLPLWFLFLWSHDTSHQQACKVFWMVGLRQRGKPRPCHQWNAKAHTRALQTPFLQGCCGDVERFLGCKLYFTLLKSIVGIAVYNAPPPAATSTQAPVLKPNSSPWVKSFWASDLLTSHKLEVVVHTTWIPGSRASAAAAATLSIE